MSGEMEDKPQGETTTLENETGPVEKAAKSQRRRPARSHPPTSKIVNAAIKELNNRRGSSLQAIKKHIATAYKIDMAKLAPFIKRYLKSAVSSGAIVQTRGKGASGSFKLPTNKKSKPTKIRRIKVLIMKKTEKSVKNRAKKLTSAWRSAVKAAKKKSGKAISNLRLNRKLIVEQD